MTNNGATNLTSVSTVLTRDATFSAALASPSAVTATVCVGQGGQLNAGASRQCKVTVALDPADTTTVSLRSGARSGTSGGYVYSSQTAVTPKLGAVSVTAVQTGSRTAADTIPIRVTVTNVGPAAVSGVALQLPVNVSWPASSPCASSIASLAVGGKQDCDAIYAIIPEVAEGNANAVNLTFTASAALLNAPITGQLTNLNLNRSATVQVVASVIGAINKEGELSMTALRIDCTS